MRFVPLFLGAFLAYGADILAQGSGRSATPQVSQAASSIDPRIKALEAEINKLRNDLEELKGKSETTNTILNAVSLRVPSSSYLQLDCADGKYQEIQTSSGYLVFFARCAKIEPYLEGFRVTVAIGNPYGISFNEFSGELGYGETFGQAATRKVALTSTNVFAAGTWTSVTVTLNPAMAKDVRVIVLMGVNFNGMRMS